MSTKPPWSVINRSFPGREKLSVEVKKV